MAGFSQHSDWRTYSDLTERRDRLRLYLSDIDNYALLSTGSRGKSVGAVDPATYQSLPKELRKLEYLTTANNSNTNPSVIVNTFRRI